MLSGFIIIFRGGQRTHLQLSILVKAAAAVLAVSGIAVAWLRFHVIPVNVLAAIPVGPLGLTGRCAGLAADTLKVHYHGELSLGEGLYLVRASET